jgi:hypothetical protein
MASIAITPATGVVTLTPQWSLGSGLAGFHHMSQDLGLGGSANNFYSIIAAGIPAGGNIAAFNLYLAGSGAATPHADIGSKLTPNSYSALTSADPDVGYGSVNFYFIHHKGTTDYFSVIVPGSGVSSSVTDLKPMSGPGGPATVTDVSGYFGLTFAAANLGYGLNQFYYLRNDPLTGTTKFGTLQPALLGTSTDQINLGLSGHNALAFTGTDVGYGTDKMYYLRLDPITGFTILGTLHPVTGRAADIANLGSVYSSLTFTTADLGFGVNKFYTTGAVNPTWQSVSFAAINDRSISAGSFTVSPSASSGLPITLTVAHGSATISSPVGGVFTVTPTVPGLITLQAAQAGATNPTPYEYNMLRQSFIVTPDRVAVDFNADAMSDILWTNTINGARYAWLMNGTAFNANAYLGTVSTQWAVTTGDFNGDGKSDLLWSNTTNGDHYIWLMNGAQFTSDAFIGTAGAQWTAATGDFNADGKSDIFWSNTVTGARQIWLMNGSTVTSTVIVSTVGPQWTVTTGDFNSDGHSDLLWSNSVNGDRYIWLMNGTHYVSSAFIGTVATQWTVATGDYNRDGQSDLVWSNTVNGDRYIWLMNGTELSSSVFIGNIGTQWTVSN